MSHFQLKKFHKQKYFITLTVNTMCMFHKSHSLCPDAAQLSTIKHLKSLTTRLSSSNARPCRGGDLLTDRALICTVVVFLSSCNVLAQGRVTIAFRKYGFLLPPAEEEERWRSGQPSTQQALISHLDVIYCGLHRENSVYCNRDHNYHRSALSQDLWRVCVCVCACVRACVSVCVFADSVV